MPDSPDSPERYERTREKMRAMLASGEMEQRRVELQIEQRAVPMMLTGVGMEQMDIDLQGMFEKILPKHTVRREMTVAQARDVLFEQECDALINQEKVNATAIELAENVGIIFVDELDKVVASEQTHGADVSRQGVQRDLLPIVEGTTVQTRYGYVRTDHILFIAAGAFHRAKPSDLMPELQGRFPIRVELQALTKDDFVRILTEPKGALTKQYEALLATEGVELVFEDDAVDSLAEFAFQVNQTTQNIGARRLYTIMERLLEELSFEAPDMKHGRVAINAAYVKERLAELTQDEDLSSSVIAAAVSHTRMPARRQTAGWDDRRRADVPCPYCRREVYEDSPPVSALRAGYISEEDASPGRKPLVDYRRRVAVFSDRRAVDF